MQREYTVWDLASTGLISNIDCMLLCEDASQASIRSPSTSTEKGRCRDSVGSGLRCLSSCFSIPMNKSTGFMDNRLSSESGSTSLMTTLAMGMGCCMTVWFYGGNCMGWLEEPLP